MKTARKPLEEKRWGLPSGAGVPWQKAQFTNSHRKSVG